MNADFENQLRRQPMRQVPAPWRAQILAVTQPAPAAWRRWFQPWPQAWATLGAAWLLIFALHLATPNDAAPADNYPVMAESTILLQERTMIMAQLLNAAEADEPPPALPAEPKPRSEIARRERIG